MSDDTIQYDVLALDAMRGVIRAVLQRVQKRGIPGDHHFYISFSTLAPGVIISKRLKDRYPEEMTVVIQHQFWDLQVLDERFEVKLSFNNVPERLIIPFASIRRFHDPSVDFGFNLQVFDGQQRSGTALKPVASEIDGLEPPDGVPLLQDQTAGAKTPEIAEVEPAETPEKKTAEIVKLDSFRKK